MREPGERRRCLAIRWDSLKLGDWYEGERVKAELLADDVEYEWVLRVVGDALDDEGGTFMSLVETGDGFVLRYRDTQDMAVMREFTLDELRSLDGGMKARRMGDDPRVPGENSDTYGDWLRSLGWELDQTGAYSVVCDDLNGSVLVTYLHLDPSVGHAVEKRLAVLSPVDRIAIQREAKGRRQTS